MCHNYGYLFFHEKSKQICELKSDVDYNPTQQVQKKGEVESGADVWALSVYRKITAESLTLGERNAVFVVEGGAGSPDF